MEKETKHVLEILMFLLLGIFVWSIYVWGKFFDKYGFVSILNEIILIIVGIITIFGIIASLNELKTKNPTKR